MDACCSIYILPFATCVQAKVGADGVVAAMHDVTIYNNMYVSTYCRFTELDCHGRRPYVEVLISLQQNILVRTKETLLVLTDVVPCGCWRAVLANILSIAISKGNN